jgi:CIC family chloride channel protein
MTILPNTGPAGALPQRTKGWQERVRAVLDSRRRVGSLVIHAPQRLRALVRGDELWLVVLAALIGVLAGCMVAVMNTVTQLAHVVLFRLPEGARLSSASSIPVASALLVPTLGGLAMGLLGLALARWWPRRAVDPIEANALYGGVMSLKDSLLLVVQTVLSNSAGASLGLEAGFTQIGSAIASRLGRAFRVRRADLRVLVGCGAAGAIGAAFNAPLTGAFYAFELVIGTYSLATLAPVMASAICAIALEHLLSGDIAGFDVHVPSAITAIDYVPLLALGILASLGGIALMRGVTLTEQVFRASRVPVWLRPAIGGLIVGVLALVTPQVMSSGHGALRAGLDAPYPLGWLAVLIALKSVASAVSIGSGFRGGLFFASLFLGAMVGKLFAAVLALASVGSSLPDVVCAVVGMSALAVAVVGGPLTMSFLALESTGSLPLTIAVLAASVLSSLTVRRTFGYSFATWRFHLRGEAIRSAVDIGWVRNLTVGRMMRKDIRTVPVDTALASFRRDYPLGSTQRVVMVDAADRYAGIVFPAEAHAIEASDLTLAELLHYPGTMLLPQMTVKEAIASFEAAESDALVVVDGLETRQVIGLLTEQHALRRYSEELDLRRRELSGEG